LAFITLKCAQKRAGVFVLVVCHFLVALKVAGRAGCGGEIFARDFSIIEHMSKDVVCYTIRRILCRSEVRIQL
jgi:hypothetical protein